MTKPIQSGTAIPSICLLSMFSCSTNKAIYWKGLWVKVYYLKSLRWVTLLMLLLPVRMYKFGLIRWICHHGVQSSGVSSSNESVNVAFVQMIFQYSAFSYSYGVVVESIGIAGSSDAALAFHDDHFQADRVSEKGTKCNQNNLMSFCIAIIID